MGPLLILRWIHPQSQNNNYHHTHMLGQFEPVCWLVWVYEYSAIIYTPWISNHFIVTCRWLSSRADEWPSKIEAIARYSAFGRAAPFAANCGRMERNETPAAPRMYHEVLEKGKSCWWLVIIIVNGVYYGRNRHGLVITYFDIVVLVWGLAESVECGTLGYFCATVK